MVHGRDALWQPGPAGAPDHVSGLATDIREMLTTTVADARPELLTGQLTGGSNTIRSVYEPVRQAAATMRGTLIAAAAQRFGSPRRGLLTRDGSVVSPDVHVHSYTEVDNSVILDGVQIGRNCRIQRAIIDKNVTIPEATSIGFDREHDEARGFSVTESGITVVGKGQVVVP